MRGRRRRRLDFAANEFLDREKLRGRRDVVLRASQQKDRMVERAQIDPLAERREGSRREEVVAINILDDLSKIRARQIEAAAVPILERLDSRARGRRGGRKLDLQRARLAFFAAFLAGPERRQIVASDDAAASVDQAVDHEIRRPLDRLGQRGAFRFDVDGRADEDEASYLLRKACGVDERKPSALAESDEVERRADFVHGDIELGKKIVDPVKPGRRRRRGPFGDIEPRAAAAQQCVDETVVGREIRDLRVVQRIGRDDHDGRRRAARREIP